jgi:hypothetical protein
MIQANELRIGNYYMYAGNNGIVYAKVNTIQYNEFGLLSDCDGVNFGICAPIPLTEEWLLKFGFLKHKGDNKVFWLNDFEFENDLKWIFWRGNVLENIKHVHQLQNLYFALTNKELNITL